MNHPVWDLPFLGSGWVIGIISLIHVSISHLVVGAGIWLAFMESRAQRSSNGPLQTWLRHRTKALLWLSSIFGASTGVGIWVAIGLVNPTATQHLIRGFVMGWAIEWLLFVGEMGTLVLLVLGYDRLSPQRRLSLTRLYALCAWLSLAVINGMVTFMLSPGAGWTQSHAMWDGFFNATYLPGLLLQTCVALALGGLWAMAAGASEGSLKPSILRPTGWITLAAVLGAVPAGWYYFEAFPLAAKELVLVRFQGGSGLAEGFRWASWGLAAFLLPALLAIWAALASDTFRRPLALVGLLLAFWGFGGFEWIREVARKPFVIREVMYANGVQVDQLASLQKDGFLPQNPWAKAFAASQGDTDQAKGEALMRGLCLACHTRNGYRSLRRLTATFTKAETVRWVQRLRSQDPALNPYLDRMPPFAGTEQEAEWVGKYLDSLKTK